MRRNYILRILIYLVGLIILALGITLNVKTGLGVSPIISVAHVFAVILSLPIGDATFGLYTAFVIAEMIIHLKLYKKNNLLSVKSILIKGILQLPLSLVFTRIMDVFESIIPQLDQLPDSVFFGTFGGRISSSCICNCRNGHRIRCSLDMRIVPNPGDGIVQAISDLSGKETGLVKNIFDGCNVLLSIVFGLFFAGGIVGIGIGTILAFLGVGRFVSLFNRFCFPLVKSAVSYS